jgi:hypothetical protein
MKSLKRLFYRVFKCYRRLELRRVSWNEGNDLIRATHTLSESEQWRIAPEEDTNKEPFTVCLERRARIVG